MLVFCWLIPWRCTNLENCDARSFTMMYMQLKQIRMTLHGVYWLRAGGVAALFSACPYGRGLRSACGRGLQKVSPPSFIKPGPVCPHENDHVSVCRVHAVVWGMMQLQKRFFYYCLGIVFSRELISKNHHYLLVRLVLLLFTSWNKTKIHCFSERKIVSCSCNRAELGDPVSAGTSLSGKKCVNCSASTKIHWNPCIENSYNIWIECSGARFVRCVHASVWCFWLNLEGIKQKTRSNYLYQSHAPLLFNRLPR